MIEEVEIIENEKMSDHKFIVAGLSWFTQEAMEDSLNNFCSTEICRYNLTKGSVEAWTKARTDFSKNDFNEDSSVNDLANGIIGALNDVVVKNFTLHAPPDNSDNSSKSYISREVCCLMKRKSQCFQDFKKH